MLNDSNTRENFCAPCAALPLAIAGLGGGGLLAPPGTSAKDYDKRRDVIVMASAASAIISVIALMYLTSGTCSKCLA